MELKELEIDCSYNRNRDCFVKINEELYTIGEAYEIAKNLIESGIEILNNLDARDFKDN